MDYSSHIKASYREIVNLSKAIILLKMCRVKAGGKG